MNHQAIYNTHPNVVCIDDAIGAKDANGDLVVIDMASVNQEEERLQAQAEAKEALRQSMISKLAATLTPEEAALLEELL